MGGVQVFVERFVNAEMGNLLLKLYERDGWLPPTDGPQCAWPGCECTTGLEVHHVIARVLGGRDNPRNLRLLCHEHHVLIHQFSRIPDPTQIHKLRPSCQGALRAMFALLGKLPQGVVGN